MKKSRLTPAEYCSDFWVGMSFIIRVQISAKMSFQSNTLYTDLAH